MDILDLLDQAEIWIDQNGVEHRIPTMEMRHAKNLVHWLERHAAGLATAEDMRLLSVPMPDEDTQAYLDVMSDPLAMDDPMKWINSTPLMIALRARTGEVAIERPVDCSWYPKPCLICAHRDCGWCPECSPHVPEWD